MIDYYWQKIAAGIWMARSSCNVYLFQGTDGAAMVNCGSAEALPKLLQVSPIPPTALLLTHSFRDACEGATRFKELTSGDVWAPTSESFYLVDAEQHWREKPTYMLFDTRWDRFAPCASLPVDYWLADYGCYQIAGIQWEVLPTPNVTYGAVSLIATHGATRFACTGDLIYSAGKVYRFAPLQYDYNDATGAKNVYMSSLALEEKAIDALLPAHGEVMTDPSKSLGTLREHIERYYRFLYGSDAALQACKGPELQEVFPRLYRSLAAATETYFVVGNSGKILAIDYGYHRHYAPPRAADTTHYRPLLHGLAELFRRTDEQHVDSILLTHPHDDHVAAAPLLKRLFGTKILAGENMSDILAHPEKYDAQCIWHEPIRANPLRLGVWQEWDGVRFRLDAMSGHSSASTLVTFELSDQRVCHIGDQLLWRGEKGFNYGKRASAFTNHIYLNGLKKGDYLRFYELIRAHSPDWILTGHSEPYHPDAEWWRKVRNAVQEWDALHDLLMPVSDAQSHFDYDSCGATLLPYRIHTKRPQQIHLTARVLNPYPRPATATLQMNVPDGWSSSKAELKLASRACGEVQITINPAQDACCRRMPISLEVIFDGHSWGGLTEAVFTIGHGFF